MLRQYAGMMRRALIVPRLLLGGALFCGTAFHVPASAQAIALSYPDPHSGMLAVSGWTLPPDAGSTGSQEVVSAGMADSPSAATWKPASSGGGVQPLAEPISGPPPRGFQPAESDGHYGSFGSRLGAVKWEVAGIAAYMTATQIAVTKETRAFHFQDEGWFGKSTTNLGVDKLTHAFNAYLITELLQARISRRADGRVAGAAFTSAVLASGLMMYSELYDAHKVSSGFSVQDVIFNTGGAAFSALRRTIPGMKEKVDFRVMIIPNSDLYTFKGKRHYAQQRFLLAMTLSGFDSLKDSPLRFVEIQAGYYATGFTSRDRARGEVPRRRPFLGVGLNLKELFFKGSGSGVGRVTRGALDYIQIPYTAVHLK